VPIGKHVAKKSTHTHSSLHAGGGSSVVGRVVVAVLTGWYEPIVFKSVNRSSGFRCFFVMPRSNLNGARIVYTSTHTHPKSTPRAD